jgi:hypothetical protein
MEKGIFDDLLQSDEESFEKILISLLEEDNVAMKTEIQKPLNLTRLECLGAWLKAEKMKKSSKLIEAFILSYRINMVSNKRQSRKEIIAALTEGLKEERTAAEKLTQPPEK